MTAIDHVGIKVSDFDRSFAFYEAALGAVGIRCLTNFSHGKERHAGFGAERPFFWIGSGGSARGTTHVCFSAASQSEVESFYTVALSMGGLSNGEPGLRSHYHPDYFGAFVLDPDGNNVEAVHHGAE